jgi:hypothetical protein
MWEVTSKNGHYKAVVVSTNGDVVDLDDEKVRNVNDKFETNLSESLE